MNGGEKLAANAKYGAAYEVLLVTVEAYDKDAKRITHTVKVSVPSGTQYLYALAVTDADSQLLVRVPFTLEDR